MLLKSPRHIFLWTTHHATVLMRRFLGHQLFFPWHGSTKSKIFGKQQASPAIWWCNLMHALSLSTLGTPFYQNWRWGKLKTKFVLFKIGSKAWGCFNPIQSWFVSNMRHTKKHWIQSSHQPPTPKAFSLQPESSTRTAEDTSIHRRGRMPSTHNYLTGGGRPMYIAIWCWKNRNNT